MAPIGTQLPSSSDVSSSSNLPKNSRSVHLCTNNRCFKRRFRGSWYRWHDCDTHNSKLQTLLSFLKIPSHCMQAFSTDHWSCWPHTSLSVSFMPLDLCLSGYPSSAACPFCHTTLASCLLSNNSWLFMALFVCVVRLKLSVLDFLIYRSSCTGRQSRKVLTSPSWLLVCSTFHLSGIK